ncbi:trihelix transcription factor GTL2 [Momordica charantia]|uniref:Trihelix transcription factor GTL2 n=1 Tax=Momordica charantia TaxID=3673 RepID=A0A6J1E0A0_MOMCH|nr:trihelix transcription factor GTL2 [Momordica charantia]
MFEGSVSEQLHQFLTPRTTTTPTPNSSSLPLPLNFAPNLINFHHPFFDSYNITNPLHPHLLHSPNPPHQNNGSGHDEEKPDATPTTTATELHAVAMDLEAGRDNNNNTNRSILMDDHHQQHHWSNDELLALLRIRSNMDNCFPESTNWEHVSRKLGEVGFRRTADKCKEKFEEESRYFNHINYNKTCRFLTHELNYPPPHHHQDQDRDDQDHDHHHLLFPGGDEKPDDPSVVVGAPEVEEGEEENGANFRDRDEEGEDMKIESTAMRSRKKRQNRKRRRMMRQKEFEILKEYCEEIVKKMMVQQEEIHSKLLHDMLKREEEKVAKEESWKKQQMERLHRELEVMAHEQAMAGDRQATIIEILNQITNSTPFSSSQAKKELQNLILSLNNNNTNNDNNATNYNNSPSSSSLIQTQTNSSPNKNQEVIANLASSSSLMAALPPHENSSSFTSQTDPKNPKNPYSLTKILAPQDPNSHPPPASLQKLPQNPKTRDHKELDDLGKRWPRDEVLALVNVRCSLYNNGVCGGGGDQDQSGGSGSGEQGASSKAPLWERISQGMLQLGYKRSAKRCKEKWENINKYFRKTKDVNKKRSLDSRTCPYFHQLSNLYNQGGGIKRLENCPAVSPENHSDHSENLPNSSQRIAC